VASGTYSLLVLDVDENGVALVEGAARESWPLRRTGCRLARERSEGQRFGHAVVDGRFARAHFGALFESFFDLGMDVEAGRDIGELRAVSSDNASAGKPVSTSNSGVAAAVIGVPVVGQVAQSWASWFIAGFFLRVFELGLDGVGFACGARVDADVARRRFPRAADGL
jgi:hypothetical protein